jgi:5-methyltetrahydropteroyltriglutamate--homocysteine methyltransferase
VSYKSPNEIGPGVYHIHSPRVPEVAVMTGLFQLARERLVDRKIWIIPDCGLKTLKWEVRLALVDLVEAARQLRTNSA